MTEWRLFEGEPPAFCDPAALRGQPWMELESQPGFRQRAAMVADLVRHLVTRSVITYPRKTKTASITDLGCGDGSLLAMISGLSGLGCPAWGYEIGAGDVVKGQARGLDVRQADILHDDLEYGELLIASEVVEHLADPEGFIRSLPGKLLVLSSPSAETGAWHNSIHAWAWDMAGYCALVQRAGWTVSRQMECDGGRNTFAGVEGPQRFQAVVAVR